jgi:hypothetical protein
LARLDPHRFGDGSRPLPRPRLERLCQLLAEDYANPEVGRALRVSPRSVTRARGHSIVRARLAYLRDQAAERAAEDAPLAKRGNRIRLLDGLAADLRQHLTAHDYRTVIGVTKQGHPIEGFDRGRVVELIKTVALLDDLTTDKQAQPADSALLGVSVTMTTEQAVTKVQALLSRAQPVEAPSTPQAPLTGVWGGTTQIGYDRIEGDGTGDGTQ